MKFKKCFQLALNIFIHSKLRSWLTIIGIVIGIAAVVSIISISLGAQQQLEERLGSLGADVLTVTKGMQRAMGGGFGGGEGGPGEGRGSSISSTTESKNLTARDVTVIKATPNVKLVMGQISGTADIAYSGKTVKDAKVNGVDISIWKDITTDTIDSGRFLTKGDSYSVVIGKNVAGTVFGKEVSLNNKILIAGKSFNVVGILEEGSSYYIPIDIARAILEDVGEKDFNSISVKIADVDISNQTVSDITKKLMLSRGILQEKNKDFTVSNPEAMQETMKETMSTMTLFLGAIAAISLIVGAIGIANTMFTSVLEKTKEIGIMKAIGTRNIDIMIIFLLNSGLIGLIGGIGGVILGIIASSSINSLAGTSSGMARGMFSSSAVNIQLIVGALLFSMIIGMIAGAIPAYRASKLNPVDALRYE
ncbi:MAG: ABC transporter permease [Candidatus Nanoarchaeia archaeon]|nr:ABC transporter permease [Candidatus Nanoarchaeia archaeon]MDD5588379.1 ABC transporter permease [Candidatus Nanoarchaeia archaeon]